VLNNFLAYRRSSRKEETDHKPLSLALFELNDSVAKGFLFQENNQSVKKGIMEHEEH